MAWFWCKIIRFLDCGTLGYDYHSDPGQGRGITLRWPCGFSYCLCIHSLVYENSRLLIYHSDGMARATSSERNAAVHQIFLLAIFSVWLHLEFFTCTFGLRHTLEHLHCGALHVSATLIPLTFPWGHPTFLATNISVMRVSGSLRGAQWLAI